MIHHQDPPFDSSPEYTLSAIAVFPRRSLLSTFPTQVAWWLSLTIGILTTMIAIFFVERLATATLLESQQRDELRRRVHTRSIIDRAEVVNVHVSEVAEEAEELIEEELVNDVIFLGLELRTSSGRASGCAHLPRSPTLYPAISQALVRRPQGPKGERKLKKLFQLKKHFRLKKLFQLKKLFRLKKLFQLKKLFRLPRPLPFPLLLII